MFCSFVAEKDRVRRINLLAGILLVSTRGSVRSSGGGGASNEER